MIRDTLNRHPGGDDADFDGEQTQSSIETVDTFNDNPVDCGETVVSIVNHEKRRSSFIGSSVSGSRSTTHSLVKEQGPVNRPELPLPAPKNSQVNHHHTIMQIRK